MHDSFTRFSGSTIVMIILVSALSVIGSLAFACAAPLAAIAAFAALTMGRTTGVALVGTAWLSNQIVGFGLLHYPQTVDTFAWGAAMGVSALIAFFVAHVVVERLQGRSPVLTVPLAFVVAFAIYQMVLFVTGYPLEGSEATLSPDVVGRVFEVDLVAFGALMSLLWAWNLARSATSARPA
jgi:hypothetical protein